MIALKGTCRHCDKVYYWTDYKTGLGKTEQQLADMKYRQTHCKFCDAPGLCVEPDEETETGKVYAECEKHAADMVTGLIKEMMDENGGGVGIKLDSHVNSCRSYCPKCGKGPLDGATGMDIDDPIEVLKRQAREIKPKAGDVTICCYCASLLIFTGDRSNLGLREANEEEREELLKMKEVQFALQTTKNIIAKD